VFALHVKLFDAYVLVIRSTLWLLVRPTIGTLATLAGLGEHAELASG
jgi:hypothetical protein